MIDVVIHDRAKQFIQVLALEDGIKLAACQLFAPFLEALGIPDALPITTPVVLAADRHGWEIRYRIPSIWYNIA